MSTFLYNNISFLLFNGSIVSFILGLSMNLKDLSVFVEWGLGGAENSITATFLFDQTSFLFLSIVLFISANVILYSRSYMSEDPNADRFILLVFAFVISMVIMIISPNIISILLGWDGLGLVSYCLVIYYPTKKSSSAGMLTVLSNRIGDVCILLTIAWFSIVGDYNFMSWAFWSGSMSCEMLMYLVVIAAMTKSAQIPFSAWLPAAMAAPTPVSALVHSSTLVTAGVYLLIRFSSTLSLNDKSFLLFISTMTMFMSGLVANFEFDLKKIIALSTLSQLGMMMFSIALGLYELAFFHLVIHALFKALLFLCAGAAIHSVGGSQDIRMYGSLVKTFPSVGVCLNYANLSLCGFPFLAGFYSKDIIIEMAALGFTNQIILSIMFISVGLTVGYSLRLTYYTFVDFPNGSPSTFVCDQDPLIQYPILNLTLFSILSGTALSWINFQFPHSILLPLPLKLLTLGMIFFGSVLSLSVSFPFLPKEIRSIYFLNFTGLLWFLPLLSGQIFSKSSLSLGGSVLKYNDQAWIEEVLLNSSWGNAVNIGRKLEWLQSNELKVHLLMFMILILFVLLVL